MAAFVFFFVLLAAAKKSSDKIGFLFLDKITYSFKKQHSVPHNPYSIQIGPTIHYIPRGK